MSIIDSEISNLQQRGVVVLKKVVGGFLLSLIRPIATTTEVILRQDLGERYFSLYSATIGALLVGLAWIPLDRYPMVYQRYLNGRELSEPSWPDIANLILGGIWLVWYLVAACLHFKNVRDRYNTKERWHSYCIGCSIFDRFIKPRTQGCLIALLGIGLVLLQLYQVGALLILSGAVSAQLRITEEVRFHNHFLDRIDSEIESENLEKSVVKKDDAYATSGFQPPMKPFIPDVFRRDYVDSMKPTAKMAAVPEKNPFIETAPN